MATMMIAIKPLFSPLIHHRSSRNARLHHHTTRMPVSLNRVATHLATSLASAAAAPPSSAESLVDDFDSELPIEEALTPPSSWYTDPSFLDLELDRVFYRGWQAVGCTDQVKSPQDFFTGRLGNVEFVVCRDDNGKIRAFHNVCRHHASLLASGSGKKSSFVCPYHGWTYALNGALLRATRVHGIRNFDVKEFGLIPLKVATWGPFVLLNFEKDVSPDQEVESDIAAKEWTGSCVDILGNNCIDPSLTYLCRREYILECNWKVFCDNYLDGGYHVPYAHKGLASGLKLDSYSTTIHEKVSLQICEGGSTNNADDFDRLGAKALYAFIYPNFMINRYGPWMDTNLVLPLGPRKCRVIFDYFLKDSLKDDKNFVERSLQDSERVQMEDIVLCEGIQKGLESPAYCSGRYAPTVEIAMYHFHGLLYRNLKG
ncbi:choline monooxygenase, chloroplastic [Eucalyptus grandis]|uniref:choline monooxygenase, chloroplastic n=1 Tax=Eucalyptus grandis TaxID=71139 RepID=UPI00192EA4AD|nr:choline monooxygenase, chloroplastic [Eucalyptus grandis]